MRSALCVLTAIVLSSNNLLLVSGEAPETTPSTVEAATVYLDRAYVTRKAEVALVAGVQTITFSGLPSDLDEGSLRAAITGDAVIDGIQSHTIFLAQNQEEKIRTLEEQLLVLVREQRELDDRTAVLQKASEFLDALQTSLFAPSSNKDGQPPRPTIADYQGSLEFLNKQRTEQAIERRAIDAARHDLQPKIEAKQRELQQASAATKMQHKEVTVSLRATTPGKSDLRISYLVPGALWIPVYDARTNQERTTLDLNYDALVQQATGEDWTNVQLTLSATRPSMLAQAPTPQPWYLKAIEVVEVQQALRVQGGSLSSWSYESPSRNLYQYKGNRGSEALNKAQDKLLMNAVAVDAISRAVEQRSTSAIFVVDGKNMVASNGKPHRVHIAHNTFTMTTTRHAIPKLSLNTYITGHALNSSDMPLLPGTMNVFVGSDLIGSANMDFVASREEADIFLGVDESIKLARRLDEKNSGLTFFSKKKRISFSYSITAENFHTEKVQVALYESLPVSQDDRIYVDIDSPSPKPQANDRGMVRWDLTLDPGKQVTTSFAYRIEYPGDLVTPQLQDLENRAFNK